MRLTFIGRLLAYMVAAALAAAIIWGVFINPWRAAYQSLVELPRAAGKLASATIRRRNGNGSKYFLTIALVNHAQKFGIRADQSEQPLHALLSQLRPGQPITVYYQSSWAVRWLDSQPNFNVYQIESGSRVIYELTEVRQRYLNQGAWTLVFLCVLGLPILSLFLRHRPKS